MKKKNGKRSLLLSISSQPPITYRICCANITVRYFGTSNKFTSGRRREEFRTDSETGRIRLPADESEVAEVSKEMSDQSRSHFYSVRHIFEGDKMPFFAEMRKGAELRKAWKGANIKIKRNFDVQAALAYCVMRHLFKTCVAEIRGKEDASKKKKLYTPMGRRAEGSFYNATLRLLSAGLRWVVGAFPTVVLTLRSLCFVRVVLPTSRTSQKMLRMVESKCLTILVWPKP